MIFLATEFDDGRTLARRVEAADWPEAERICDERGWQLDGELIAELPAGFDMDDVFGLVEQLGRGGLN